MDQKVTDNSGRFVSCSFCNERFPSSKDMGDHLMTCGNKTDQCPKCKQYVRRAIFAYHYESGCAPDPDALTGPSDPVSTRLDTSSTTHRTLPSQPQSESVVDKIRENDHRSLLSKDGGTHQLTQDTRDRLRATVTCPFCSQEHELGDSKIHKEKCLLNPVNVVKRQRPLANGNSHQTSDRSQQFDEPNDSADIPCEYCNEPIKWRYFQEHAKACRERDNQRTLERSRRSDLETSALYTRCEYCGEQRMIALLEIHKSMCYKNPRNIEQHKAYVGLYRLLPPM